MVIKYLTMKKVILLFVIILFSCEKKQEKLINDITVNIVSTGEKYGRISRHPFTIIETIIKNDDCTMLVYKDTTAFKRVDTLKLYKDGKIIFNNVEVEKVDIKSIADKNATIVVQKIYIPHVGAIGVDDFAGQIVYLANNQIVARYGTISNNISLYNPELYFVLHNDILYGKIDFKRHARESEALP
mgnify:CR=1 FL=1